jgi:hypothetical protein
MQRIVISLAVVVAVASALLVSVAPATARERSCGNVTTFRTGSLRVVITRGGESCSRVRGVAKSYMEGHFTVHGPDGPTGYVTMSGGWRCSVINQGFASCQRGGSSLKPREAFELQTP